MDEQKKRGRGRPRNEIPTREVRYRWPYDVADWIEEDKSRIIKLARQAQDGR